MSSVDKQGEACVCPFITYIYGTVANMKSHLAIHDGSMRVEEVGA